MANQLTALDHVSDGRAIAGLGAGWQVNEHTAYGVDLMTPADRSDRFEESVAVIRGGEKRTIPMAARYADVWHIWGTPESYARRSALLDEACAAVGRDPAEIRRATGHDYPVGIDIAAALEPYREVCDEFVVFDWFDRPLQATIDDLTAALG